MGLICWLLRTQPPRLNRRPLKLQRPRQPLEHRRSLLLRLPCVPQHGIATADRLVTTTIALALAVTRTVSMNRTASGTRTVTATVAILTGLAEYKATRPASRKRRAASIFTRVPLTLPRPSPPPRSSQWNQPVEWPQPAGWPQLTREWPLLMQLYPSMLACLAPCTYQRWSVQPWSVLQ